MKRLLLIPIFTCLFVFTACTQENKSPKAWMITFETHAEPLPGAPQNIVKRAQKLNDDERKKKVLLSDSLFTIFFNLKMANGKIIKLGTILNRRDSVLYSIKDGTYTKEKINSFTDDQSVFAIMDKQHYPDSIQTILGWETKKFTYKTNSLGSKEDTLRKVIWYAPKMPNWFLEQSPMSELTGFPLKTVTQNLSSNPYLKFIDEAVSIEQVTLEESNYYPPEGAKIIDKTKKEEK